MNFQRRPLPHKKSRSAKSKYDSRCPFDSSDYMYLKDGLQSVLTVCRKLNYNDGPSTFPYLCSLFFTTYDFS